MSGASSITVAEFYQQLALLTKARLPLPESLRQIAASMRERQWQSTLTRLSEQTLAGATLSAAMADAPRLFSPLHVKLVAVGERTGMLPAMLSTLARLARQQQGWVRATRAALAYPLTILYLSLVIWLIVVCMVLVPMGGITTMMGRNLPPLASLIITLATAINSVAPVIVGLVIALGIVGLWLFSGSLAAMRACLLVVRWLPGARRVAWEYDHARLCAVLSLHLRHRVPLGEALTLCATVLETARLRRTITGWSGAVTQGQTLADCAATPGGADPILVLALRVTSEDDLADHLQELSALYEERAEASRQLALWWWSATTMVVTIGGVGLTFFLGYLLPLIKLVDALGGGD